MSPKGEKCFQVPITRGKHLKQKQAPVSTSERGSFHGLNEEGSQQSDGFHDDRPTYNHTYHQAASSMPLEIDEFASLFTARGSSIDTRYSYQNTSSARTTGYTDETSNAGQASRGEMQLQMQLRPSQAISTGEVLHFGTKSDFLHVGAQFYGSSEQIQREKFSYPYTTKTLVDAEPNYDQANRREEYDSDVLLSYKGVENEGYD